MEGVGRGGRRSVTGTPPDRLESDISLGRYVRQNVDGCLFLYQSIPNPRLYRSHSPNHDPLHTKNIRGGRLGLSRYLAYGAERNRAKA